MAAALAGAEARRVRLLSGLAACLLAAFIFYGYVLPQTPGRVTRPAVALAAEHPFWSWVVALPLPVPRHAGVVAAQLLLMGVACFGAYGAAVYLAWRARGRRALGLVAGCGVLFAWVSLWSLPNFSTDIYNYMLRGRLLAVHGANPYYVPADRFTGDPLYPYAGHESTNRPNGKFPAWMLINIGLARLGADRDVVTNLLIYRGTFFIFNLLSLGLIAWILWRRHPHRLVGGLTLYAWNPILVMFGQSKTDIVMVFYLLVATALLVRGRRVLAMAPLAASVFVKLITLPLAAVLWLGELRQRRWRELIAGALLFAGVVLLLYAPLAHGPELLERHLGMVSEGGAKAPGSVARTLAAWSFLVVVVVTGLMQDGSVQRLLRGWGIVLLYFSIFMTRFGFSWYLLTLIAVVASSADWRLHVMTIITCFASFQFNMWQAIFTPEFRVAGLNMVPGYVVFLVLPCSAGTVLAGLLWWRRRGRRRLSPGEGGGTPGGAASCRVP